MTLSRRHFLTILPGFAATLLVKPTSGQTAARPKRPKRILIVGAGFAGSMVALSLKKLVPKMEVVVIEKGPAFIAAPSALEYVFGMKSWAQITRGYKALTLRGIRVLRAEVQAVEPQRAGGPDFGRPSRSHVEERRKWERGLLREMFGA